MNKNKIIFILSIIVSKPSLSKEEIISSINKILNSEKEEREKFLLKIYTELGIENSKEKNLEELDKEIISKSLIKFNYNFTKICDYLNISKPSLYQKRKKYNI